MPTALDNGRRSPRKLLRAVVARLRGLVDDLLAREGQPPPSDQGVPRFPETTVSLPGAARLLRARA